MLINQNSGGNSYAAYKNQMMKMNRQRKGSVDTVFQLSNVVKNNDLPREKQVGKIIRRESKTKNKNDSSIDQENSYCSISVQPRNQIMLKVKTNQLLQYSSKKPLELIKEEKFINRESSIMKTKKGVANIYEQKIAVVLDTYQSRRNKIDDEIQALRKNRKLSLHQVVTTLKEENENRLETPKFICNANNISQTITNKLKIKPGNNPKWSQILASFRKQIEFEQKLRNCKHMIKSGDRGKVSSLLSSRFKINDPSITILEAEQYDPYFKTLEIQVEKLSEKLAESWEACQLHWKTCLKNRYNHDVLITIFEKLQGKEKKAITLQSLVREFGVLFQNQKYLRNRDLYRIYQRISPFSKEKFLSELGVTSF